MERREGGGVKLRGFFLGQFRDCLDRWGVGERDARRLLDAVIGAVERAWVGDGKVVISHDGFKVAVKCSLEDGRKALLWVVFESDDLDRRVVVRMVEAHVTAAPAEKA